MKNILITVLLGFFLGTAQPGLAQSQLTAETVQRANAVVLGVFQDLMRMKPEYPELTAFDRDALRQNPLGIYEIHYVYRREDVRRPLVSEIGFTVTGMQDARFQQEGRRLTSLGFPLLNLKILAFHKKPAAYRTFDLTELLQRHGRTLWDYQQQFLPMQLKLTAEQEVYETGQPVVFTATLTNLSQGSLRVKDLNTETLFFLYDGQPWGAAEVQSSASGKSRQYVLHAGQSITKTFRGQGFGSAREFEIFASYSQTIKGVEPTAVLRIRVQDPEPQNTPSYR